MQPRPEHAARLDESSSDLAPPELGADLETSAQALEQALALGDLGVFYRVLRGGCLPFLPVALYAEPHQLVRRVIDVVWRLGSLSPAVALAVENHYSVLCPIATLPAIEDARLAERRRKLLAEVKAHRWLVANTNSRIHDDQVAKTGTVVHHREEGFVVSGKAVYMSLASESDLVVFVTFFETGEPALFACSLKGNPGIEIGPLLFPDAMRDSDTRSVVFHDLELDDTHLLFSGREHPGMLPILTYQQAWHQMLLAALALGTTARALEEGRLFLRAVKRADGQPLGELDGMVVDMGRQLLRYRAGQGALEQASRAVGRVAGRPLDPATLGRAYELACAAKYACTALAEDVVGVVRRIIGARCFTGGHPMERLSKEVVFGQLGGEVNAAIERRAGKRILGESSFLDEPLSAPLEP